MTCTDVLEGRTEDMEMSVEENVEMGSMSHGVEEILKGERKGEERIVSGVSGEKERMVGKGKGKENTDEGWNVWGNEVEKGENEMLWERVDGEIGQMKEKIGVMREGKGKKRAIEEQEGEERREGWKVEIGKVEITEKMIEENFQCVM